MLPKASRMTAADIRYLFARKPQKIHAQHLTAHVFFLSEPPAQGFPQRFGVLLRRGSYTNSPHMHRLRRLVYAALGAHLAQSQNSRRLGAYLCGIMPHPSFAALSPEERTATIGALLDSLPSHGQ